MHVVVGFIKEAPCSLRTQAGALQGLHGCCALYCCGFVGVHQVCKRAGLRNCGGDSHKQLAGCMWACPTAPTCTGPLNLTNQLNHVMQSRHVSHVDLAPVLGQAGCQDPLKSIVPNAAPDSNWAAYCRVCMRALPLVSY
jgi:hypothetical protein